ncbi:MAG: putative phage repressor [Burkholderiales bacterium]|jgi:phage repressor protein C with HTH and peptisase S24 domain|nr:putative phage repressor [Burkholderiales bacterium]MCE3269269.1 putative phage repressor [Burkholderiales bacterium]
MNINKTRITNLKRIILENYNNSIHQFAKSIGRHSSQFYNLFKGDRSFGQKLARNLEVRLNLPALSLDKSSLEETIINKILIIPHLNINALDDYTPISNKIFTLEKAIAEHHGWSIDKLRGLIINDESMSPIITLGSKIIIDISQKRLYDDKIYVLSQNNKIFIKRIFHLADNILYEARSDNIGYETIKFRSDQINIIGRVLCILNKIL